MHRVHVDFEVARLSAGEEVAIEGEEAHHALRVKRVRAGEHVAIMDGRGGIAEGVVAESGKSQRELGGASAQVAAHPPPTHRPPPSGRGSVVRVVVERVRRVERMMPRLEVLTATPKGGRADGMIDQLSQAGAAAWSAMETAHGVVDPREAKLARLERIALESSKQCGRAWVMEIGEGRAFAEALKASPSEQVEIIVADASGEAYTASGARVIRLLVGPEGGFTGEEMRAARAAGARVVRFGPHVMRIETAAVVAAGVVMGMHNLKFEI